MARVCGCCGATQGPFAREFFGGRTGQWVFTCAPNYKGKSPEERRAPITACLSRRAKQEEGD